MEYLRLREKGNANIKEIRIKGRSNLTSSLCVNRLNMKKYPSNNNTLSYLKYFLKIHKYKFHPTEDTILSQDNTKMYTKEYTI